MIDRFYIAVGDVHGEAEALAGKLVECDRWIKLHSGGSPTQYVFLGDYIDRGHEHTKVLELVRERVEDGAVCLIGNHEGMMIGTVDGTMVNFDDGRKERNSDLWQVNNGVTTCREMFGPLDQEDAPPDRPNGTYGYHVSDYAKTIAASWEYKFLKERGKLKYETRCVFFSHAPQSEKNMTDDTLLWGNRRDYKDARRDAIFKVPGNKFMSVHGHMHMSSEGISFPRLTNFVHGSAMRTVVMADCGCGSSSRGELHPVIIREREWLTKGGVQSSVGVVAIL